jgi:hypothetical protein
MTCGRAAWAVISKENRLNPSPSTVILIAVPSGYVSGFSFLTFHKQHSKLKELSRYKPTRQPAVHNETYT